VLGIPADRFRERAPVLDIHLLAATQLSHPAVKGRILPKKLLFLAKLFDPVNENGDNRKDCRNHFDWHFRTPWEVSL
jgi:hypothetical protein